MTSRLNLGVRLFLVALLAFLPAAPAFATPEPAGASLFMEPGVEELAYLEVQSPQMAMLLQATLAQNNFAGTRSASARSTTTASGTVSIKCGTATCAPGVYRVDFFTEITKANWEQTSPNLSAVVGWTARTGAKTASVIKPDGTTTVGTGTTGAVFWGSMIVNTLDGTLSIAVSLSGTTGSQKFDWTASATRLY